jgi:alpha-L-rhamnosidase
MSGKFFFLWILPVVLFLSCNTDQGKTEVVELRCRNLINPEGINDAVFSWKIKTEEFNFKQIAWEIEIASSEKKLKKCEADVWGSGRQASGQQLNIDPSGVPFAVGNKYWWRVRIWDAANKVSGWSLPAYFSVGPNSKEQWQAQWITAEWEENTPMPYFRKTFDMPEDGAKPERAVVYLSGLGCSDLYVNGKLVDETRILDPAQTNYEQYALYSTFDITSLLERGKNCVGVMLGDGWYNQGIVWRAGFSYGKPLFILQMEIMYDDGSRKIVSSDEAWTWAPGPIIKSNIYAGEVYDANKAVKGWSEPGMNDGDWKKAQLATGIVPPELRPQMVEPIRMKQEISPVDIWQTSEGKWIFDFGVNVAAIPCITISQPKGTRLTMCMGEYLAEDRTIDYRSTGVSATKVIQTDEYICDGSGIETWSPRFTYHGFRYLELSGNNGIPDKSWIKIVTVYTDASLRGEFECSDPQINRLHEMAVRTMLGNIHGLPTDCPVRERCGWLGDAHAVAPFENCNYDLDNFWVKYLEDIRSSAAISLKNTLHHKLHNSIYYFADKASGIPFMVSPGRRLCGVASPDWGTAIVQLPWYTYLYFGNENVIRTYYPSMKQWVDYIDSLTENHIVPYGLGDWCPPGGNNTIDCPISFSSTAFHYLDVSILSQVARILGRKEDAEFYERLKEDIGKALLDKYFDVSNATFGSQTADAMALDFGFVPEEKRKAVSDAIVRNMQEKYDNFFHVGIFGLGRIGQALSRYGNSETAWKTFTKKGENSFEWMWKDADATTLWEILPVNTKSKNPGRSLNHPMQATYDTWFYEDVAGIRPSVSGPGYKITRFDPTLTGQLTGAKASINTPYGKTVSDWKDQNGKIIWNIVIPPNTSGLVVLPSGKPVQVNHVALDNTQYPVREEKDETKVYYFPSGNYIISY